MVDCLLNCPRCGKEIREEDALFCPYCVHPLKVFQRRSGFPVAAGVLAIIASCLCLVWGVPATISASVSVGNHYLGYPYYLALLGSGMLGIAAFALGLTASIVTLKRQHFGIAITGQSIVIASSIVVGFAVSYGFGWIFEIPVLVLSIISVVFTAISKSEFT
jgi:hypothetical protein